VHDEGDTSVCCNISEPSDGSDASRGHRECLKRGAALHALRVDEDLRLTSAARPGQLDILALEDTAGSVDGELGVGAGSEEEGSGDSKSTVHVGEEKEHQRGVTRPVTPVIKNETHQFLLVERRDRGNHLLVPRLLGCAAELAPQRPQRCRPLGMLRVPRTIFVPRRKFWVSGRTVNSSSAGTTCLMPRIRLGASEGQARSCAAGAERRRSMTSA